MNFFKKTTLLFVLFIICSVSIVVVTLPNIESVSSTKSTQPDIPKQLVKDYDAYLSEQWPMNKFLEYLESKSQEETVEIFMTKLEKRFEKGTP